MTVEILYGRHAVHEALRSGRRRFYTLNLAAGIKPTGLIQEIMELARGAGASLQTVDRQQFGRLLSNVNHQGVALEVGPYPYVSLNSILELAQRRAEQPFLLLLDHLEDPQNVGTLLRTAEAMGVHGVLLPRRRAASVTPAVSNASAGAVEHLLVDQVTNLARALDQLKGQGVWIAGLEDRSEAQDLATSDLSGPLALVVGAEGSGLSRLVREKCDWLVRIPMVGRVGSLNVAVAGSIALVAAHATR
jgi:23S rRNA (guanosine2251-2'-O)-methyltransferase